MTFVTPSYGLICKNQNNQFVFVQRKNTVEYIEIICGNYLDFQMLKVFLYKLTMQEKSSLLTKPFAELWQNLWKFHFKKKFTIQQKQKFESNIPHIKRMIYEVNKTNNDKYTADITLPKGRKGNNESSLDAAIREFEEETGIPKNNFTVYPNNFVIEQFVGTNGKRYSTQYYYACMKRYFGKHQLVCDKKEVSAVLFLNKNEAFDCIDIRKPELRKLLNK